MDPKDPDFIAGLEYLEGNLVDDYVTYFDSPTRQLWRVDADDVAELGRRLRTGMTDAYSLWCAETDAEPVG